MFLLMIYLSCVFFIFFIFCSVLKKNTFCNTYKYLYIGSGFPSHNKCSVPSAKGKQGKGPNIVLFFLNTGNVSNILKNIMKTQIYYAIAYVISEQFVTFLSESYVWMYEVYLNKLYSIYTHWLLIIYEGLGKYVFTSWRVHYK